jgi:hypothetical protein
MLQALADRVSADFLLVSEPNQAVVASLAWHRDQHFDSAICQLTGNRAIVSTVEGQGWVCMELSDMLLINVYVSPNIPVEDWRRHIQELEAFLSCKQKEAIVCGDFNAKSPRWGCSYENTRGAELVELFDGLGMICLNIGDTPTFQRGITTSILDISFATINLARQVVRWEVLDEEILSDHQCILIEINEVQQPPPARMFFKKANAEQLGIVIEQKLRSVADPSPQELTNILQAASREILQRQRNCKHPPVYWWTQEISALRQECLQKRRTLQRLRSRGRTEECLQLVAPYSEAKKKLRKMIKDTKRSKWLDLCDAAENDLWGTAFKILTRRWGRRLPTVNRDTLIQVVEQLFPVHPETPPEELAAWDLQPFTREEVQEAANRMKPGRSGGPDGTPPEAIIMAARMFPQQVTGAMNRALTNEEFPRAWKDARLALISKRTGGPNSFRPLCLLNVVGKFFEQLLGARLRTELEEKNILSTMQYGFRKGRSTIDAIEHVMNIVEVAATGTRHTRLIPMVVTLDIRNAFNSASWKLILQRLAEKGISLYIRRMVQLYLNQRTLVASSEEGTIDFSLTSGVPQGSVIGPTLWNVLYDGVLRLQMPEGVTLVGYADDLALVATAKNEEDLMMKTNRAIAEIDDWLKENKLTLASEKTEAVIMAGRRKLGPVVLQVGDNIIHPVEKIKYLGVWLDRRRSFLPHVTLVADKAEVSTAALSRMMLNVNGPKQGKRKVLASVIQSVMLYAAPIWSRICTNKRAVSKLQRVNRRVALRVCSAYRTVSDKAAHVVAGIAPIDLLIQERVQRHAGLSKTESQQVLQNSWSERWAGTEGWTGRLIPHLLPWINRQHGEVNHWLTQFITGHGIFSDYLKRIGKATNDTCWYCEETDTVEHTFFHCNRWLEQRERCWRVSGRQTPDTIIGSMLSSKEAWLVTETMVREIMTTKAQDERRRQWRHHQAS